MIRRSAGARASDGRLSVNKKGTGKKEPQRAGTEGACDLRAGGCEREKTIYGRRLRENVRCAVLALRPTVPFSAAVPFIARARAGRTGSASKKGTGKKEPERARAEGACDFRAGGCEREWEGIDLRPQAARKCPECCFSITTNGSFFGRGSFYCSRARQTDG